MYPLTNKRRNIYLKNNININNQIKPENKLQNKKDIPVINSNSLINTSIELSNKKNKMNKLKTEFYWESLNQKYPYNPQKKYCVFFNGCCCPPHRGHINAIREAFKTWPNCKVIINQLGSSGRHGVPSAFNSYLLQKYLSDVFDNSTNIEYMFRESSRTIFSHDFVTDSDVVVIIRGEEFENSDDINESIIKSDSINFYETFPDGKTVKLDLNLSNNFVFSSNNNFKNITETKKVFQPMELVINEKNNELSRPVELFEPIELTKSTELIESTESKKSKIVEQIVEKVETEEEKRVREEKEKKKEMLVKACEEVMDLYNLELSNIKKTENMLKTLDTKLEKLANKKRDKIMKDITRTKSEYETWKKIKYQIDAYDDEALKKPESELELRENPNIPILFMAKYNFIEHSNSNEKIRKIYETLNQLNLEELFIKDTIDLESSVIKFCDKYYELSKKDLHYKFDHDWDYLDTEMNVDSKSGSLPTMTK